MIMIYYLLYIFRRVSTPTLLFINQETRAQLAKILGKLEGPKLRRETHFGKLPHRQGKCYFSVFFNEREDEI